MGGRLRALIFGLGMVLATPALAEQRTLVVGVEEQDYQPAYGWHEGDYRGAAREILDAFAADRGYHLEYRPLPVKRLYAQLVHREVDLKFPDNPAWAADLKAGHEVTYSGPVIRYTDGVLVRADRPTPEINDVKTLGTVAGFTPVGWGERIAAGTVTVKETTRAEQAIRQVVRGLTDGVYVSVAAANRILDQIGMPGALVFAPSLPHGNGSYLLSSGSHPEVIADFDTWLAANAARVQAIRDRTGAERGVEK